MPDCKACGYSNRAGVERCEQCSTRIIDEGTEPIWPQPSQPTDQAPEEDDDLEDTYTFEKTVYSSTWLSRVRE